ncbi:hypothetical protein [Bacillus mesophilum]|uniref:Uncharacterized protein n=1 Tax=Bacillus mesophilum TaxID=1071718 RepID=A0A7V7RNU9_9BACI|nr:hypothetical protein [Bacillus mesophilum]KAB2334250.1 hypothetical protein F7732_09270 [Bacillus mesophilum]
MELDTRHLIYIMMCMIEDQEFEQLDQLIESFDDQTFATVRFWALIQSMLTQKVLVRLGLESEDE